MEYTVENYAKKAREAAAEGVVLLKNDNAVLPLSKGEKVALFGRSQFNYYKSGTGSGGLVNTSYVTGVREALLERKEVILNEELNALYEEWLKDHPFDHGQGWASEPWFQEEMPITEEIAAKASETSDTAIVLIGRSAGEDHDNLAEEGSYLLTKAENEMIKNVCAAFERTVVLLNVGNIIDMSWVKAYNPSAVAYIWQGGQEGGNGAVDVVMGEVNPSGKLPDTIVNDINDIPSTEGFANPQRAVYAEDIYVGYRYFETFAPQAVAYPFGFGLSYTCFEIKNVGFEQEAAEGADGKAAGEDVDTANMPGSILISVEVTNTGDRAGKEVVQLYASAPQGKLGKPAKVLVGFVKTALLAPGESEVIMKRINPYDFASYDDGGLTGNKSCYVLEAGEYGFFAGSDVRSAQPAGSIVLEKDVVLEQLTEAMAPEEGFDVLVPECKEGVFSPAKRPAVTRSVNYTKRVEEELPQPLEITGDKGIRLSDVADGDHTMEEFIAQLSPEDLASLTRGEGMCSPKVTPGIAGAIGGLTENLKNFGLPAAGVSDGPSGIRMDCGTKAFAMPNGTLLASTFNADLCTELYEWAGAELRKNKIDSLLGPGMNIHRSPLNGRNFEYFSEDPYLTGKMAAAQLEGMHKYNVTGTIKHFCCNNQETNRHGVEAVVSERALREIYLKGFEIAVKEAGAYSVMTSYNPVNGHWTASNYELIETILRKEWGFDGIVMTDWWAKGNFDGEKRGELANTAAKVQAGNDLFMVNADASDQNCDNTMAAFAEGKIIIGQLQRNAMNICGYLMRTPAFDRMLHGDSELDEDLKSMVFEGGEVIAKELTWYVNETDTIEDSELACERDDINLITVVTKTRGMYGLKITCRASEGTGDLAQLPLTVFKDNEMIASISITGADKEWKTFTFNEISPFYMNTSYLKLYFAQGGMEVKDVKLTLLMDLEEKIKAAMSAMGN